jgi:hypothetical protein
MRPDQRVGTDPNTSEREVTVEVRRSMALAVVLAAAVAGGGVAQADPGNSDAAQTCLSALQWDYYTVVSGDPETVDFGGLPHGFDDAANSALRPDLEPRRMRQLLRQEQRRRQRRQSHGRSPDHQGRRQVDALVLSVVSSLAIKRPVGAGDRGW